MLNIYFYRKLHETMECVMKFSVGCQGDDETAMQDKMKYLSVANTKECKRPSWCSYGDMADEDDGNKDMKPENDENDDGDEQKPEEISRKRREAEDRMGDMKVPEALRK